MAGKKNKNKSLPLEIRIEIDGIEAKATADRSSTDFDRLLRQRSATSFVFIPLAKPQKRRRRNAGKRADAIGKKTKLPDGDWFDGEVGSAGDRNPVPGVLAFDIRRRDARDIAGTLGVKQFFWGASGTPVEQHAVQLFDDDDAYSWNSARRRAIGGLTDMVLSARNIASLAEAVHESQTTMQRFWQLAAIVLGLALAAGALQSFVTALASWLAWPVGILFYPFVFPAVLVGIYLRVLARKGDEEARDFTVAEAQENWFKVAPHLLALWVLCWIAVLLLTWVRSTPVPDLPFLDRSSGVTTSFIVCVWMLLPIANSRDVETLLASAFESGILALVSIFTIRLSLYVTNLLTDMMWGFVIELVPFEIPERLQQIISSFINVAAEVFFLAVLLGYAWDRTRQQFTRL